MASQSMEVVAKALEQQMLQSVRIVEEQLDAEMTKLDRLDEDELEHLKERRLESLRKAQKQKQVGVIGSNFFLRTAVRRSNSIVCLFNIKNVYFELSTSNYH